MHCHFVLIGAFILGYVVRGIISAARYFAVARKYSVPGSMCECSEYYAEKE